MAGCGLLLIVFALLSAQTVADTAPPAMLATGQSINIDVGWQLFVDDYLIAQTTLARTFQQATLHQDAPIIKAETELETQRCSAEGAVLFDGGVWFDPKDHSSRCGTPGASATASATRPARTV